MTIINVVVFSPILLKLKSPPAWPLSHHSSRSFFFTLPCRSILKIQDTPNVCNKPDRLQLLRVYYQRLHLIWTPTYTNQVCILHPAPFLLQDGSNWPTFSTNNHHSTLSVHELCSSSAKATFICMQFSRKNWPNNRLEVGVPPLPPVWKT